MRVVVPYDARRPKTRLAGVLEPDERAAVAEAMLRDVLAAIEDASRAPVPEVVATAPVDVEDRVRVDERSLDPAVNDLLAGVDPADQDADDALAVVMADLGLLTAGAVDRLLETDGDVVLVPGRGGGTNAFVARHPAFRVDYHGVSIRDHRAIADRIGATVGSVDSYRLSTDVDERSDLAEVLLHGEGRAADWLRDRGFEVALEDGRVGVERT